MEVTLLDGTILWGNRAFEELVDYTASEFKDLTWKDLTVDHGDLEHDERMAGELVKGHRESYSLHKQYRRKNGGTVNVTIHVSRWPESGGEDEFEFFLVTALPLDIDRTFAIEQLMDLSTKMNTLSEMARNPKSRLDDFLSWGKDNPWKFGAVCAFIAFILFGDRVIEVLRALKETFG